MRLVDTRRLTGPNHLAPLPLVIVEIALEAGEILDVFVVTYLAALERMREALGLPPGPPTIVLPHLGGGTVGYEAPIDTMLAFAEMSEWAAECAIEALASHEPLPALPLAVAPLPLEPKRTEIATMLTRLADPSLLALAAETERRGVALLWDDDVVSVGLGCHSVIFSRGDTPPVEAIDWDLVGRIPVAMVTGTNGKTTSTRLLARIATEAGHRVGSTSSDGITVAGAVIEEGDWTGPGAARLVLRHPAVDFAVLETARGGILRRGLAVAECDVAVITNVTQDHLGRDGVDDTAAMTRVKSVIARATGSAGAVVLNAHDENLVALATELRANVTYFADLERNDALAGEVIARHRHAGSACVVARAGEIVCFEGDREVTLMPIASVPITMGGKARYNVENVLGVVAAARALGLGADAIERGLATFAITDNPGRGQLIERRGVHIMLDFGHNPEGVRAVLRLVATLRKGGSGGLTVIAGCAGDRSDHDIAAMAGAILEARPDRVLLRDLSDYLRGRAPGEVPSAFQTALREHGFPDEAVVMARSEVDALEQALAQASSGDFIVLLAHVDHDPVAALLGH